MKRIIVLAAAFVFGCTAMTAQNKGDMSVGGILGFSAGSTKTNVTSHSTTVKGDSTPSTFSFEISGEFGYFFADNWKIGAALEYGLTAQPTTKDDDKWLKDRVNLVAIGPTISYYLRITDKFYYTPAFGIFCTVGNYKSALSHSVTHKQACAGFAMGLQIGSFEFKPAPRWGIAVNMVDFSFSDTKIKEDSDNYAWNMGTSFSLGIKPSVGINYYF